MKSLRPGPVKPNQRRPAAPDSPRKAIFFLLKISWLIMTSRARSGESAVSVEGALPLTAMAAVSRFTDPIPATAVWPGG